jgi:broad-specificity NMP kinase
MTASIEARRVLVTGTPGVGKSTVCRLVAEGLTRSTVIEADVVRESIVSGFVQPDLSFPEPFVQQVRLQREVVNMWIERMVQAGYTAIVDDGPMPPPPHFENDYRHLLAQPTSLPVVLTADHTTLRARLQERGGRFDVEIVAVLDDLLAVMDQHDWSRWLVIDTTGRTPNAVAARILSEL